MTCGTIRDNPPSHHSSVSYYCKSTDQLSKTCAITRSSPIVGNHNHVLRQPFVFMAKFIRQYKTKPDSWHAATLHGHYLGKTFFITEPEQRVLKEMRLLSVSQIFEIKDNMTTSDGEKTEHLNHHPSLCNKQKWLCRKLQDMRLTQTPAYSTSITTAQALILILIHRGR
jgi:hypothetical protein